MFSPSYNGSALGWNANYYFKSFSKSTWYVSTHAYYESYKSYAHGYHGYFEKEGAKFNSAAGYQWRWSRVNLMTGLGTEYKNQNSTEYKKDFDSNEYQNEPSIQNNFWLPYFEVKLGFEI
jgi:hypothetical protein